MAVKVIEVIEVKVNEVKVNEVIESPLVDLLDDLELEYQLNLVN